MHTVVRKDVLEAHGMARHNDPMIEKCEDYGWIVGTTYYDKYNERTYFLPVDTFKEGETGLGTALALCAALNHSTDFAGLIGNELVADSTA